MIDLGQSHKMRRYYAWIKDIRVECERLRSDRETFRDELNNFTSSYTD
jgi:hypothetical protein